MNHFLLDRVETESGDALLRFMPDTRDLDIAEPVLPEWIVSTVEYSLGARMPAAIPAALFLGLT
jgi:hypothetical protein